MVCLSLMVCYSVFDCCSTGWAEPVNSSRASHQLWTICMDFFSDQLFCVTYYWPSVTCTALVYLLDTKPWPDIWTVIVALLYALFRVIGFVEHSFFLSKVDELVRGIAPLVYFASPSCFHVYVCTTIWILLLFSQNAFFPCYLSWLFI